MKEITNNEIKNYNLNLYNLANEKIEKLKINNKYNYNQMLLEEIECDYSTLKLILRQLKDKNASLSNII